MLAARGVVAANRPPMGNAIDMERESALGWHEGF